MLYEKMEKLRADMRKIKKDNEDDVWETWKACWREEKN